MKYLLQDDVSLSVPSCTLAAIILRLIIRLNYVDIWFTKKTSSDVPWIRSDLSLLLFVKSHQYSDHRPQANSFRSSRFWFAHNYIFIYR